MSSRTCGAWAATRRSCRSAQKLLQLVTTFVNYDWPLDVATAGFAIGLPALCLIAAMGQGAGSRWLRHGAAADRVSGDTVCLEGDLPAGHPLRHHAGLHAVRRFRSGALARVVPPFRRGSRRGCCWSRAWAADRPPGPTIAPISPICAGPGAGAAGAGGVCRRGGPAGGARLLEGQSRWRLLSNGVRDGRTPRRAGLDRASRLLAVRVRRAVAAADRDAGTVSRPRRTGGQPADPGGGRHRQCLRLRLRFADRGGRGARPAGRSVPAAGSVRVRRALYRSRSARRHHDHRFSHPSHDGPRRSGSGRPVPLDPGRQHLRQHVAHERGRTAAAADAWRRRAGRPGVHREGLGRATT